MSALSAPEQRAEEIALEGLDWPGERVARVVGDDVDVPEEAPRCAPGVLDARVGPVEVQLKTFRGLSVVELSGKLRQAACSRDDLRAGSV